MVRYTSEDIHAYAKWLARACQEAGLDAEQRGAHIVVRGATGHLDETITCGPDERGQLRWRWSWGAPICRPGDADRPLGADDVDELVRSIGKVVAVPIRTAEGR